MREGYQRITRRPGWFSVGLVFSRLQPYETWPKLLNAAMGLACRCLFPSRHDPVERVSLRSPTNPSHAARRGENGKQTSLDRGYRCFDHGSGDVRVLAWGVSIDPSRVGLQKGKRRGAEDAELVSENFLCALCASAFLPPSVRETGAGYPILLSCKLDQCKVRSSTADGGAPSGDMGAEAAELLFFDGGMAPI